jgi:hypothetical protein
MTGLFCVNFAHSRGAGKPVNRFGVAFVILVTLLTVSLAMNRRTRRGFLGSPRRRNYVTLEGVTVTFC